MSYQVLARKWRPQNFKEMVGQEHVLRALINALDNDRLHHAYLFTGTRGVGKTTIARILAKCLNCETGVTSEPCGTCSSCKEIVTGNFVDLIEVDAASRTKVEDTRELLDNVQYAPTRGRFKVYLIDEVHMLTGHSFNALLKTLEEPPPHVKFLFATTDPQKLPVTVLSRCLQFNLKRMPVDMISGHLDTILKAEKIPFDDPSLRLIARGADGSMRDALSLLDQSIAFGGNELKEADVREMLGTISHEPLIALLKAVSAGDGLAILNQIEDLSGVTPDFEAATDAMISLLHELAVKQVVPKAHQDDENVTKLAQELTKEEVQLFYQIALQGRRDLPLSPEPRSGFEMILLRMMSFRPLREGMQLANSSTEINHTSQSQQVEQESKKKTLTTKPSVESPTVTQQTKLQPQSATVTEEYVPVVIRPDGSSSTDTESNEPPPWEELPPELDSKVTNIKVEDQKQKQKQPVKKNDSIVTIPTAEISNDIGKKNINEDESTSDASRLASSSKSECNIQAEPTPKPLIKSVIWHEIIPALALSGRSAELIKHCLLVSKENGIISLSIDKASAALLSDSVQQEIQTSLTDYYGETFKLNLLVEETTKVGENHNETPAQRNSRLVFEKQQQAENNIATDPFVIELQSRFGAQIVPGSVHPKNNIDTNI